MKPLNLILQILIIILLVWLTGELLVYVGLPHRLIVIVQALVGIMGLTQIAERV